jgi:uncharacterized protein (TIGR02145 family)
MNRTILALVLLCLGPGIKAQLLHPPVVYQGHSYPVVRIGAQWWFAENLRMELYRNGDTIPTLTQGGDWRNARIGAQAVYRGDPMMLDRYGRLYNWYAATDPRGLCPQGWHVPTAAEWDSLAIALGGDSVAGGALKDTVQWDPPNTGATNASGFNGRPGGARSNLGDSMFEGAYGYFWTATPDGMDKAVFRFLGTYNADLYRNSSEPQDGFSCRCVKDEQAAP